MHNDLLGKIRVNKKALLEVLRKNLQHHRLQVESALINRRNTVARELQRIAVSLGEDLAFQPPEHLNMPMPRDNTEDYQRAIKMIEMTQDDIIDLEEQQFDKLVMDNWQWKADFLRTSALYDRANHE